VGSLISIDLENARVIAGDGDARVEYPLASAEAFSLVSKAWLRAGWDTKYVYSFSWLGRPVIQLPEDLIRIQEVIYQVQPDVIIETGVAHGGSLVFYASLCAAMGKGRVIGVDVEIRPHNRKAIEEHRLFPLITLIEGSSIDPAVVSQVSRQVQGDERVLVLLDSCHSKEHVSAELAAYAPMVTVGSYIVVADGIMASLAGAPRSQPDWEWNNPLSAVREFVRANPAFQIEQPQFPFNEGVVDRRVTYWPDGFVRRTS
jgi:cephalosporin hydroxylase